MSAIVEHGPFPVAWLNRECSCIGADLDALRAWVQKDLAQRGLSSPVVETHPHLASALPVFVLREHVTRMGAVVAAVESLAPLPACQAPTPDRAPAMAGFEPGCPQEKGAPHRAPLKSEGMGLRATRPSNAGS
jgi:hypothetical protein